MSCFVCLKCFSILNDDHSLAQTHVAEVCQEAKMLCAPCGKSFEAAELEQHGDCTLVQDVDTALWSPKLLLPRLMIVLKEAKANPTLTREAEAILAEGTFNVLQLPIKTILQHTKVAVSPELADLLVTIWAREPNRFKREKWISRPTWSRLVQESSVKLGMSDQNRRIIREILSSPISAASHLDFCQRHFPVFETRTLAMKVLADVCAAFDASPMSPADAWLNHLMNTLASTPMSTKKRNKIMRLFNTSPCPMGTNGSNYAKRNFLTREVKDLAEQVITEARATFTGEGKPEQEPTAAKAPRQPTTLQALADVNLGCGGDVDGQKRVGEGRETPFFMCLECLAIIKRDHLLAQLHLTDVCKNSKMLCVPCGKSTATELDQHSDCKLFEHVDPAFDRPKQLLPRLLTVLKEARASPELTKEAESILNATTVNVVQFPIKTVLRKPKVAASPELIDLLMTVFAREPNRFKREKWIGRPTWLKLVHESSAKLEMSEENRKNIRDLMLWPILAARQQDFCERNFQTPETRALAKSVLVDVCAAFDALPMDIDDQWLNYLMYTLDSTPMSNKKRNRIRPMFITAPCSMEINSWEYAKKNFPMKDLQDVAEQVITMARSSFRYQVHPEPVPVPTDQEQQNQPETDLSQVGDELEITEKLDSGSADGDLESDRTEPTQQPDTNQLKRKAEDCLEELEGSSTKRSLKDEELIDDQV